MFDKNKFKGIVVAKGKDMKEIAKSLGVHETTLYRKLNDNGNFSREEIESLIVFLHIENPMEIFFTDELA